MQLRSTLRILFILAVVAAWIPRTVRAQEVPHLSRTLSVSAGASQFDLSGTGTSAMAAVRIASPVTRLLIIEAGASLARPAQQFGDTTTLIIPEIAAQLQIPGRFAPFVGIGAGAAIDARPSAVGGTRTSATFSGAVGARYGISSRLGGIGELRVRGIGENFGGSTAEWTLGGYWRL